MLTINVSQKANFFDRKKVADAIGRANANAMGKGGSFIRQRARSSMRRRKKPSAPGTPPSAHAKGFASLKTILFAFDFKRQSVVVGPVLLNGRKGLVPVPNVQEFGGTVPRQKPAPRRKGRKATKRQLVAFKRKLKSGQIRRKPVRMVTYMAKYPERPFMGPALKHVAKELPGLWRGTVRAA